MTTLYYDHTNKVLFADGRETGYDNQVCSDKVVKIERLEFNALGSAPRRYVLACSGATSDIERYKEALKENNITEATAKDFAKNPDYIEAFLWDSMKGIMYIVTYLPETNKAIKTQIEYNTALGSGRDYAIAYADLMGNDGVKAINYAATRITTAGPCYTVMPLQGKKQYELIKLS